MPLSGPAIYKLSDYRKSELSNEGIFVESLEAALLPRGRTSPHYHEFFQIFFLRGQGMLMHDFVDHRITGPTLVFMSPGQVHAVGPAGSMVGTCVSFSQIFFDNDSPPPSRLLGFPFVFPVDRPPLWKLPKREVGAFEQSFREMQQEFEAALPGARAILRAQLEIVLTRGVRSYGVTQQNSPDLLRTDLVREFRIAVESKFRHCTALSDYAALLNVSANYLNDLVREATGQSAGRIIRERRLLDAKRLLLHSEMSVSEVCYELGFKDPSYFSRFFRRYTGEAPADFRLRIREKYQERGI